MKVNMALRTIKVFSMYLTTDDYQSRAEDGHSDEENQQVGLEIGGEFSLYSHLMIIIVWTELQS